MNNETKLTAADLALYLGCECQALTRTGTIDIVNSRGFCIVSDGVYSWSEPIKNIKPILRPLSDMTEDEALFCEKELFNDGEIPTSQQAEVAKIAIRDHFGTPKLASWRIGLLITRYLLSSHFDLFGWIDAGLAIDKTKAQQHERRTKPAH